MNTNGDKPTADNKDIQSSVIVNDAPALPATPPPVSTYDVPNVLYVIDTSGSTSAAFSASPPQTVLQFEQQTANYLNSQLTGVGYDSLTYSAYTGVEFFTGDAVLPTYPAALQDMDPTQAGTQASTNPANTAYVTSAVAGAAPVDGTDFYAALTTAATYFTGVGTAGKKNVVIFLSDGSNDSTNLGNYLTAAAGLKAMGVTVFSYGIGPDADLGELGNIASSGTATNLTNLSTLNGFFAGGGQYPLTGPTTPPTPPAPTTPTMTYTPTANNYGYVDVEGLSRVYLNSVGSLTINGLQRNAVLNVNLSATTASTTVFTPGATVDSGTMAVNSLLPMSFVNMGTSAEVEDDDPLAGHNDTLVLQGTAGNDAYGLSFTAANAIDAVLTNVDGARHSYHQHQRGELHGRDPYGQRHGERAGPGAGHYAGRRGRRSVGHRQRRAQSGRQHHGR